MFCRFRDENLKKSCKNYNGEICTSIGKKNSSESTSQIDDNEIATILSAVFITKHNSTCKKSLEHTLCIEKYLACGNGSAREKEELRIQLVNERKTFCETCLKYSHIKNNASLPGGMDIWLKNSSCISTFFSLGELLCGAN